MFVPPGAGAASRTAPYPLRGGPSLEVVLDHREPWTMASQLACARQRPDPGLLAAEPTQACQAANDFVSTLSQALLIQRARVRPRQRANKLHVPACQVSASANGQRQHAHRRPTRCPIFIIEACTCHTMQTRAWRADQPASLAVLQIRLIKTVKHKSLTRCPAFVHTADTQQATRHTNSTDPVPLALACLATTP